MAAALGVFVADSTGSNSAEGLGDAWGQFLIIQSSLCFALLSISQAVNPVSDGTIVILSQQSPRHLLLGQPARYACACGNGRRRRELVIGSL